MDPATDKKCEELERLIISNGLDVAKWGGINQGKLPGLDRAMQLIKIQMRRRPAKSTQAAGLPQAMPPMVSLLDELAAMEARNRVVADQQQALRRKAAESLCPMPVPSEAPSAGLTSKAA